jgi:hypothetical protein
VQYTLVVDQLALKRWHGKIDAMDALIIAFVASLNPHNQAVAKRMRGGMFELSREWIREEVPLLDVSADWIGRRLAALRKIGLLDLKTEHTGQRYHTYGKLSKLYFAELEKAKKAVEKVRSDPVSERDSSPYDDDSERDSGPFSRGENSLDHPKMIIEEGPPPPLVAAGGVPQDEEKTGAAPVAEAPLEPRVAEALRLVTETRTSMPSDAEYAVALAHSSAQFHARNCGCEYCKEKKAAKGVAS